MDNTQTYYAVIDRQGRVRADGIAMTEVRAVESFTRRHRLTWAQAQIFGYSVREIRIEIRDPVTA